jgi:hypothetical protein
VADRRRPPAHGNDHRICGADTWGANAFPDRRSVRRADIAIAMTPNAVSRETSARSVPSPADKRASHQGPACTRCASELRSSDRRCRHTASGERAAPGSRRDPVQCKSVDRVWGNSDTRVRRSWPRTGPRRGIVSIRRRCACSLHRASCFTWNRSREITPVGLSLIRRAGDGEVPRHAGGTRPPVRSSRHASARPSGRVRHPAGSPA